MTDTRTLDAASCCAQFYQQDVVRELLGDSFHPGGLAGSRRLLDQLSLAPRARVLDVACGVGTTAIELARAYGVDVVGIDLGPQNLEVAQTQAEVAGVRARVDFQLGDASALPFADESFDAVICECAVSTFADKPKVAAELARVVRRGGRIGISDMVVEGPLPTELSEVIGPWACVESALTVEGYQALFLAAGLRIDAAHDDSATLEHLATELKRRLVVVGLGQLSGLIPGGLDLQRMRRLLELARDQVRAGSVQYWRMSFGRGRATDQPVIEPAPAVGRGVCDPHSGCC